MPINSKKRKEIEAFICQAFDAIDSTRSNSDYYKKLFASLNDQQFNSFISKEFPYKFHERPFEIEPTMEDIKNGLDFIGVPLMEKVALPYLYENKDGEPVMTQECLTGYIHHKKVQQFITKKNAMSVDISTRDMKTGLLTSHDKNGKTSDREMECLAAMGLYNTMDEFSRYRADSMNAKNNFYNTINTLGQVSLADTPVEVDDSLSKNLMSTYLVGCHINTNLVNQDYYLPFTLKNKKKAVTRI